MTFALPSRRPRRAHGGALVVGAIALAGAAVDALAGRIAAKLGAGQPAAGGALLSAREVAARLRIDRMRTLPRLVAAGLLRPVTFGREARFDAAQVEQVARHGVPADLPGVGHAPPPRRAAAAKPAREARPRRRRRSSTRASGVGGDVLSIPVD